MPLLILYEPVIQLPLRVTDGFIPDISRLNWMVKKSDNSPGCRDPTCHIFFRKYKRERCALSHVSHLFATWQAELRDHDSRNGIAISTFNKIKSFFRR